uniref:Solute carrier organic anion transporter family member n=1 Tax=Salvator merianae TaxID=96440 RepID=A0A8D0BR63_SALMN
MTSTDPDPKSENGSNMEENLMSPGLETEVNRKSSAKNKNSCCNGLKAFLAALAFVNFTKGFAGIMMKSSFTQLERRFGISSSTAGFVDGSFEMGNLLVIAFVSYFGAAFHRPRVIALGCFVMSLGSFLTAMPHFFMGLYKYDTLSKASDNSTFSMSPCSASQAASEVKGMLGSVSDCEKEVTSNAWIYVMMGNVLRGIGETPVNPLGISYLDDFARPEDTPFYIGFFHTVGIIGPIAGFLLGSVLAKLYVDIGFVDLGTITITPSDSRWVGAWWMGFLIASVLLLLSGIPFCFLPRSLDTEDKNPSGKEEMDKGKKHNDETHVQKSEIQMEESWTGKMKGFLTSMKRLLGNRLYFLFVCGSLLHFSSFIGYLTYNPKYIEQQYGLPASKANFIMGAVVLPISSLSVLLGGFIMKKYKIDIIGAVKMLFTAAIMAFLISLLYFTVGCENRAVAGLTVAYDGQPVAQNAAPLTAACNANCACAADRWDPVCGNNGITYMSACFAGCKNITGSRKEMVFHNCSCIEKLDSEMGNSSAVLGECRKSDDCSRKFIYFLVINVACSFLSALGGAPFYIILMRCVPKELKSLSLGLFMLIMRALGGIPSPVYFGAVLDLTCMKWARKSCGKQGACMFYDTEKFRYSYFGLVLGLLVAAFHFNVAFFILVMKKFGGKKAADTENKKEDVPLNENENPDGPALVADRSDEERDTHV